MGAQAYLPEEKNTALRLQAGGEKVARRRRDGDGISIALPPRIAPVMFEEKDLKGSIERRYQLISFFHVLNVGH